MMKKVGVIVQARMGSTRLPGKVAKEVCGKPILTHIIERLKRSQKLDQIIVATSKKNEDQKVIEIVENENIATYRGSEDDVLNRYIEASEEYQLDVIVRVTGDCPLLDPFTIDELIREFIDDGELDYMRLEGYPRGLDAGICNLNTLKKVESYVSGEPDEEKYREHVTLYIYRHPEKFNIGFKEAPDEMKRDYRLCVDEMDDYQLIKEIYDRLYREGHIIDIGEVIDLLDNHPELVEINTHVEQKKY